MKKLTLTAASISAFAAAHAAQAQQVCFDEVKGSPIPCPSIPEISALEGTAALATIAAVVLLAWERRRRSA